jgi:hypothetical protein
MTTSSNNFVLSADLLHTMRRLLTPNWGAANPTPSAAHMTRNISSATLLSGPVVVALVVVVDGDGDGDGDGDDG